MGLFSTRAIIGASAAGAYEIEKSLRFNSDDSAYLTRTPSTTGNAKVWTFSAWIKRTELGSQNYIYSLNNANGAYLALYFTDDNLYTYFHPTNNYGSLSSREFRDPGAWFHIVHQVDALNTIQKIWINGSEMSLDSSRNPGNNDYYMNTDGTALYIGKASWKSTYNDMYLAETYLTDGHKYEASDFGETDITTGQWIPKKFTGSYGTNGFHLKFDDNSGTTATTLGKDSSGNGNNFTPNNFSVAAGDGNDSKTDTPTSNKATISPLTTHWTETGTVSDGNLKLSGSAGFKNISTIGFAGTSKFYYEGVRTSSGGWQLLGIFIGATDNPSNALSLASIYGFASTGNIYQGGSSVSGGPTFGNDDVMGLKYNNGTLQIYKNGTVHGTSISSIPTTDTIFAYIANDNTSSEGYMRFSAGDWTQASGASVDATWELSTANIPDPTITKPDEHFVVKTYSGTGSTQTITTGLDADFIWVKRRDSSNYHILANTISGANNYLVANNTDAESVGGGSQLINGLSSTGFQVGTENAVNNSSGTYVSWNWKESASAGFDLVAYAGDGNSGRSVSHSLGVIPELMIIKRRTNTDPWAVYHKDMAADAYVLLDQDVGKATTKSYYSGTRPTSSVFTVGDNNGTNGTSNNYFAYLFSSVVGFSKIGAYEGVGGTDGPYVDVGFRPSYVLIKNVDSDSRWWITKTAQLPGYNAYAPALFPNNDNAETNESSIDLLSNGFKIRNNGSYTNENGSTHIYLAFAESPFKYANAR